MSKIDEYISARAEFVGIDERRADLGRFIASVGAAIERQPDEFMFSNTSVGLPAEVVMRRSPHHYNGDDWRSAENIMTFIKEWHDARSRVQNAWGALNADQRAALQAPPKNAMLDHNR